LSNLRKYFQYFQVPEGYLTAVGRLLRIKAKDMTPLERVAALSFDEIHLKSEISYDMMEDSILGPHTKANTMLMRGIFKRWKIPVWYR
jgi:hypothetical protein